MDHGGACQSAQSNQQMSANTMVDFRVTAIENCDVAHLPAQYKCDQQCDVRQYGQRQKNSFHSRVPVTEGRLAGSEATTSLKE